MKNEKENAILISAYHIFKMKGYSKATVSDIAKGAGVGKGTIYEYFENKYDLFYKMIEHLLELSQIMITEAIESEEHPVEKLKAFYRVNKHQANLAYTKDVSFDIDNNKSILDKVIRLLIKNREKNIAGIKKILEECIQQGIIKEDIDIKYASTFLFSIFNKFSTDNLLYEHSQLQPSDEIQGESFIDSFIKMLNG